MQQEFRCVECGRLLFKVTGGYPTTALSIKCSRCGATSIFNYLKKDDCQNEHTTDQKPHDTKSVKSTNP